MRHWKITGLSFGSSSAVPPRRSSSMCLAPAMRPGLPLVGLAHVDQHGLAGLEDLVDALGLEVELGVGEGAHRLLV